MRLAPLGAFALALLFLAPGAVQGTPIGAGSSHSSAPPLGAGPPSLHRGGGIAAASPPAPAAVADPRPALTNLTFAPSPSVSGSPVSALLETPSPQIP